MTEKGDSSGNLGKSRGFEVNPDEEKMVMRGLNWDALEAVMQELLEEDPDMSLQEAIRRIEAKQEEGKNELFPDEAE